MTDTAIVRKALAVAFCTRTAIYHGPGDEYRTVPKNVSVRLEPRSALVNKSLPWIVYTSLTMISNKHYLEVASPIEAEWLVVGTHLDKELKANADLEPTVLPGGSTSFEGRRNTAPAQGQGVSRRCEGQMEMEAFKSAEVLGD